MADDSGRARSQSESANWVKVQKNTFTNWCNDRLKDTGLKVVDLATQFDDGITLLKLLEVLAYYNKSKLKYKKNPRLQVQKTENLAMAFDFMKKVEKIELVNIGPQDINEHNLKLMLGLVWTLIQRYQLGIGAPEEEPPPAPVEAAATPGAAKSKPVEKKKKKGPTQSAKSILLGWVNATLPDIQVKNFTTDWNDGRKISALVDSMKPGLIPDHATLNPDDRLENTGRALNLAEEHFGVPQIIAAEDLCVDKPDELSVLTYIGYYCNRESVGKNSLLDWINSKIPKYNISDFTTNWKDGMALGCLTDVVSGGQFTDYEDMTPETPLENVTTSMDYAENSLGIPQSIKPEQFIDPSLDPVTMMAYLTRFKHVKPSADSLANITATGPGISGDKAGKDTNFIIKGRIPDWAPLDVNITGPDGSSVPFTKLDPIATSNPIRYKPTQPGKYTVEVLVNKEHIRGSPFSIHHSEPSNAGVCFGTGNGLTKAIVGEKSEFTVDASQGGPGQLQIDLNGPHGNIGTEVTETSGHVYAVNYTPIEAGPHTVSAMWAGNHIDKSPFTVRVIDPKKCTVTGPGLTGATVNQPATFYVKTKDAGQSTLSVTVSGPSGDKVPVKVNEYEPECYMCSYTPVESGNYSIDARWEDIPITGSPFHVMPTVPADASKCKVKDLPTGYLRAGKEVNFGVDVSGAGDGLVKASGHGSSLPQKCVVRSLDSNSFEVSFSPFEVGKLNVDVTFADQPIPGSPFAFSVNDPTKCRINSAALKEGEYMVKQPIDFKVSAQYCGEGKVTAKLHGPKGEEAIQVEDSGEGTYLVHFTPSVPGSHAFDIFFDGEEIPDAPVNLFVNAGSGSDDVIVTRPAADRRGVFVVDAPHDFKINSSKANDGQLTANCVGMFTAHKPDINIKEIGPKDHVVSVNTSVPDDYKVNILWSNDPVPGSPFSLTIVDKARPEKVIIRGPTFDFTHPGIALNADVKDAGVGELSASCRGNRVGSVPVAIKEVGPKLHQLNIEPSYPDQFTINVLWDDDHVPGSPFKVDNTPPDAGKVIVTKPDSFATSVPAVFNVDATDAGVGKLKAHCRAENSANLPVEIAKPDPSVEKYRCSITPIRDDVYHMSLLWSDNDVPGSPFKIDLVPKFHSDLVVVEDPLYSDIEHPVTVNVDCTNAGAGKLSARCKGEASGPVPVSVAEIDPGKYKLEFQPPREDDYKLGIFYNNEEVPRSPFSLTIADKARPEKVIVRGPNFDFTHPGITLNADVKDAGAGKLSASCRGNRVGRVPVDIKEVGPKIHQLSIDPPQPDQFTINVLWDDEHVPGSPFKVDNTPPDAGKVIVTKPDSFAISVPAVFNVDATDAGVGNLKAHCRAENSANLPVEIAKPDPSVEKYRCSITPIRDDVYHLSLLWSDKDVPGSPFKIDLVPKFHSDLVVVEDPLYSDIEHPVTVNVDCTNAGAGKLSARCKGEASGPVPVSVAEIDPGKYKLEFQPPREDDYKLNIFYNKEEVPRSPFSLTITDKARPEKVIVRGPNFDFTHPGITLNADVKDAGAGKLSASCRGNRVGSVPVGIKEVGPKLHQLSIDPPQPDQFTINVLWDDDHVPGSPFEVDNTPPDAGKVIVTKPDRFATSVPAVFNVDATDAGVGKLKAHCRAENSANLPVEIVQPNPSIEKYRCSITPIRDDVYHMSLLWSDKDVPGSPFKIDLAPRFHSDQVIVEDPLYSDIEHPVTVNVDCTNAGAGKLSARCKGEASGPVPVSVAEIDPGKYKLEFQPPREDDYKLNIFYNKEEVPRSPFSLTITDKARPEKVIVRGPNFDFTHPGITLNADVKDAGAGKLSASCRGNRVGSVPVDIKEVGPKLHQLSIDPPQPDQFTINVLWDDEHVPGSPFKVDNTPPDAGKVIVTKPDSFATSVRASFRVDATDAGVGNLKAHCRAENSANLPVEIAKPDPSIEKYRCSITPIRDDVYHLSLLWSDKDVPGSPFKIDLVPKIHADRVVVQDPFYGGIEDPVTVNVDCTNAGSGKLSARCKGEASGPVPVSVAEIDPGKYKLEFQPPREDDYKLNIFYNNEEVPRSPIDVSIHPIIEPMAELVMVEQEHAGFDIFSDMAPLPPEEPTRSTPPPPPEPMYLFLGDPLHIDVEANGDAPELTANAEGDKVGIAPVNLVKKDNGDYSIDFHPTKPDRYVLSLKQDGKDAPNSPLVIYYSVPIDATKCVIIDLEKVPFYPMVNDDIGFGLDTSEAGKGDLKVTADGPSGSDPSRIRVVNDTDHPGVYHEGIYRIYYTPTAPGEHRVHLQWGDKMVPGCPLVFNIVSGSAISGDKVYPFGSPITLGLAAECKPKDLEAYAVHDGVRQKVKVSKEKKPGNFRLSWQPTEPGTYDVHVLLKGKEVAGSPYELQYSEPPNPSKVKVDIEPKSNAYVNYPITFSIDTREAGKAELLLRANIAKKLKEKSPDFVINKNDDGTYTATYTPSQPVQHSFEVLFAGQPVKGSPFKVSVTEKPLDLSHVIASNLNLLEVHKAVDVYFQLPKGDSISTVTASATGKTIEDADFKLQALDEDGFYRAHFVPSFPDDYQLELMHKNVPVAGSPFPVKVVGLGGFEPSSTPDDTTNPPIVEAKRPFTLLLPLDLQVPPEELNVDIDGPPESSVPTPEIKWDKRNCHAITLTPDLPGHYLVHVNKDDTPVSGSPFRIIVKEFRSDPSKCFVVPEDQPIFEKTQRFGKPCHFRISTIDAGPGTLNITSRGPGKADVKIFDNNDGTYTCEFSPSLPGQYGIDVLWDDQHIGDSPYTLNFKQKKKKVITGLNLDSENFRVGVPHRFKLHCDEVGEGKLEVSVRPSGAAQIKVSDIGSDSYQVEILPQEQGNHELTVQYGNSGHILGSPFNVVFNERGDASKCHMISNDVLQDEEGQDHVVFIISTKGAGKGKLSAHADNPHSGERLPVIIDELEDDQFKVHFDIGDGAEYQLTVKYDTVHIEGSPFKLLFADQGDASACQAEGDGLTVSHVDKETKFSVLCEGAGEGTLSVDITAEDGTKIYPHVSEVSEVEYEVSYNPVKSGKYKISVKWGDEDIPDSPFDMKCYVPLHASNLKVIDPPSEAFLETPIIVNVKQINEMDEEGEVAIVAKSRSATVNGTVEQEDDGTYKCTVKPTVAGKYVVKVTLNGENITDSPFKIKVSEPPRPENVKASGPGLDDGYVGQEGNFMLETGAAGTGTLSVRVHGPKGAFRINMRRHPDNDRNILVRYDPKYSGKYSIDVTWSEVHIPGSPFKVEIFDQKEEKSEDKDGEEGEEREEGEVSLTNGIEDSLISRENEEVLVS